MGFLAKHKQRLLNVGAVIAVALMLLWPAFVNGEPFYMPDTSSYLRGADAVVYRLTRQSSAWTAEYLKRYSPTTEARVPEAVPALHSTEPPVVLAGRSIYYGLVLYCAQWLGNFWAVAALQALLVAVAISLTVATLAGQRSGGRKVKMTVMCGLLLA